MIFKNKHKLATLILLTAGTMTLQGCDQTTSDGITEMTLNAKTESVSHTFSEPMKVQHALGTVIINQRPQHVVALDMNEVDFLDQLGISVVGMPKDFIPHFLAHYKNRSDVLDTGAIVRPNIERVHAIAPDLILLTSLQAHYYEEISEIAPTIHLDVNGRRRQIEHIEAVKNHLITLGRIFGRTHLAEQKIAQLNAQVNHIQTITRDRPEKALILLHNNGSFTTFGIESRYGFVFSTLGVKPAISNVESGPHGQSISSETILKINPDVIYLVDRTAVMEHRPLLNAETLNNPLLRHTNAWKNGRVIFADPHAWYITAASPTSLRIIIQDLLKGYSN